MPFAPLNRSVADIPAGVSACLWNKPRLPSTPSSSRLHPVSTDHSVRPTQPSPMSMSLSFSVLEALFPLFFSRKSVRSWHWRLIFCRQDRGVRRAFSSRESFLRKWGTACPRGAGASSARSVRDKKKWNKQKPKTASKKRFQRLTDLWKAKKLRGTKNRSQQERRRGLHGEQVLEGLQEAPKLFLWE